MPPRPRGRTGLSFALYPPGRHLQPALIAFDKTGVTFRYKDYRHDGPERPMAGVRKPSPSVTLGPVTASWLLWLRPSALLASLVTHCGAIEPIKVPTIGWVMFDYGDGLAHGYFALKPETAKTVKAMGPPNARSAAFAGHIKCREIEHAALHVSGSLCGGLLGRSTQETAEPC
jgi:hypothetical protein